MRVDQFSLLPPDAVLRAMVTVGVRGRSAGKAARPGRPLVGCPTPPPPAEVPFGAGGLTLYPADLAWLAKVQAGRAARNGGGA